jgi:pimeloyl-ACP methyl ester carboxylesterase
MTATRSASPQPGRERNELRALGALAFEDLAAFPGAIRDVHLGIAERAFRGVGPAARPVRTVHDTVSRGVYDSLRVTTAMLGWIADRALESGGLGAGVQLSATPRGSAAIGALNGLIGDRLERQGSDLHTPMSVRVDGEAVALAPDSLAAAFPAAEQRLVVFVHGLMGTELYWAWGGPRRGAPYGARLAADLGCTPLYVRYNSGRHISENGRSLAALLDELVRAWPVEVTEIALVGHSMGGLVARSAAHHGQVARQLWPDLVGHVVTLGTPHLGAPLEQGAHVAAATLNALPETRMLASLLRRRSAGIRDLRHGSLVDEDWRGRDPEALRAAAVREVPLLEGATHCFVSATVTADPRHPLGRLLGDTLVLVPSASGRGRTRRIPFADEHGHHVGSTNHLALLNHPAVYERLHAWLATRPPAR